MRTTITLHDDLAVRLEQLRHERGTSFKATINDILRAGLDTVNRPTTLDRTRRFTQPLPGKLRTAADRRPRW